MSILLADVVSVGSRVVSYHDGVCGKADMLVLVNLFNRAVECRSQTVGSIASTLARPMLVVPRLVWAALIAIHFLLVLSALAKLVRLSSARVMLLSRNRLSLSRRRQSVCLMCRCLAIFRCLRCSRGSGGKGVLGPLIL